MGAIYCADGGKSVITGAIYSQIYSQIPKEERHSRRTGGGQAEYRTSKAVNRREGEQQETGGVEEKKEKEKKKNRRITLG